MSSSYADLSGIAKPDKHIKSLTDIANYLKQHGVEKVGLYGLCWGSKPGGAWPVLTQFSLVEKTLLIRLQSLFTLL